jgi:hypothetical protein
MSGGFVRTTSLLRIKLPFNGGYQEMSLSSLSLFPVGRRQNFNFEVTRGERIKSMSQCGNRSPFLSLSRLNLCLFTPKS